MLNSKLRAKTIVKIRVNTKGGGLNPLLSVAEEVCLFPFSLRHSHIFEILGLHFGVSKTKAKDTIRYWLKILRGLLPESFLKEVASHPRNFMMVQEWTVWSKPEDAQYQDQQRSYFSRKKQQHTFKPVREELTAQQQNENKELSELPNTTFVFISTIMNKQF